MVQNLKEFVITCMRLQVLSIHSAEIEVSLTQNDILKIKYTKNCLQMRCKENMVIPTVATSLFATGLSGSRCKTSL